MAEALHHIVQALSTPIEAAGGGAQCAGSADGLRDFVTRRILETLTREIFAPPVETDLLALRQVFVDYGDALSGRERAKRLAQAREILGRLKSETGRLERGSRSPARPAPRAQDSCDLPIRFARGVGPKRAALMERVGIRTVADALWYLPRRYEDRSVVTPIRELRPGQRATICGRVVSSKVRRTHRRGITILEVQINDETGTLPCLYYNQPYLETTFTPGTAVMASGVVSSGRRGWMELRMDSPQHEVLGENPETTLHVGRIVPIYPETKGLTSRQIRTVVKGLLEDHDTGLAELIPQEVLVRRGLPTYRDAVAEVHFPSPGTSLDDLDRGSTPAHRRLAFEELFVLELALAVRQRTVKEEAKGIRFHVSTPLLTELRARLPFELTPAQQRVWGEIARDMAAHRPMNRLIQGDVGCGKTIVALHAIVVACGSGYQAALMAPTEILAEQHFLNVQGLLESLGLKVVLLKHGVSRKLRAQMLEQIRSGAVGVVIGTHALIQKEVQFANLGLAVVDEQHKFGVLQRKTLLDKGYRPDVLVLTATPIPRTLAMTVYGDLDLSVIDALPPGRRPVHTLLFHESRRRKAYDLIRTELRAGRQAYIVYPLVEESEKSDLQAALQGADRLREEVFSEFVVRVLHGRMKTEEKAGTMRAFKGGDIHVLVATTVVEVGVDVSNASVMVVEHAERFGLAQLHQLRGRVGRGAAQSYCVLITMARGGPAGTTPDPDRMSPARQRLDALVRSSDGFVIAEEDLKIRGPGEFFGTRQWGVPEFRAANLVRDGALLERARQDAFALLAADPQLAAPQHRALKAAMLKRWQEKLELGEIG